MTGWSLNCYIILRIQCSDDFRNYSDLCFQTFGDRVKHWTTINEPQVFGQYGYKMGSSNPNPNPATDPYLATHHIILAHAAAAKLYKEKYQVIFNQKVTCLVLFGFILCY